MLEEVIEILESVRDDIDFRNSTDLIDNELLDSFDVVSIVSELTDRFDIMINVNDLKPENFNSPEKIVELIKRKQA